MNENIEVLKMIDQPHNKQAMILVSLSEEGRLEAEKTPREFLSLAEENFIDAAHELLNGTATKEQREHLIALAEPYREALTGVGAETVALKMQSETGETEARTGLIELLTSSVHHIISDAAYDHYQTSPVEKARHFLEQTKLRRTLGKMAIGGISTGVAAGALKGIELIPGIERVYAVGVGIGAASLLLRFVKPQDLIKKVVEAPSKRFEKQARTGIDKHDPEVIQEVMELVKSEVRTTQDKETSKRRSYELIAERSYMGMFEADLWALIGPDKLQTQDEKRAIIAKAVDSSVDWLLSFYGLKQKDDQIASREEGALPLLRFDDLQAFPCINLPRSERQSP